MKYKKLKVLCVLVLALMLFISGCGTSGISVNQLSELTKEKKQPTFVNFNSSDSGLDSFVNEYLRRHLRFDSESIGTPVVGDCVMFGKEWEAKSLVWFDSTSTNVADDRHAKIKKWVNDVPIDRFGYVWSSFETIEPDLSGPGIWFKQGWPFPAYNNHNHADGFEFNQKSTDGWTVSTQGGDEIVADAEKTPGVSSFDWKGSAVVELLSPNLSVEGDYAPFVEVAFRMSDTRGFGPDSSFEEIKFMWQTESGGDRWNEVSSKDFATIPTTSIPANVNREFYFPMYLKGDLWNGQKITKVKFQFVAKDDTINATVASNYVRFSFDTRMPWNNSLLLTSAAEYYKFVGDDAFLEKNLNKFRQAAWMYITIMNGSTGLVNMDFFPGHDDLTAVGPMSEEAIGHGLANGWWDITSFPSLNLDNNINFYKLIKSLIYLEEMAQEAGIELAAPSITLADGTQSKYEMTIEQLKDLLTNIRTKIQETFYDEETGRFFAGRSTIDYSYLDDENNQVVHKAGDKIDYGFVYLNLIAVTEGIATEAQANSIMSWINGDRIIEGDNYTGKDIYKWDFAPAMTTKRNVSHYVFGYNAKAQWEFGGQVQDGGTAIFLSYYDLMARNTATDFGAESAFDRLKSIQTWYESIKKAGGQGVNFYRDFYDDPDFNHYLLPSGEPNSLQGNSRAGGLGLDFEFVEASLLYASVPYLFFGLDSFNYNELSISPTLPESLEYWEIENLMYHGVVYDYAMAKDSVILNNVRGDTTGLSVRVNIRTDKKSPKVYVNGQEVEATVENGIVSVVIPFKNCSIAVK